MGGSLPISLPGILLPGSRRALAIRGERPRRAHARDCLPAFAPYPMIETPAIAIRVNPELDWRVPTPADALLLTSAIAGESPNRNAGTEGPSPQGDRPVHSWAAKGRQDRLAHPSITCAAHLCHL